MSDFFVPLHYKPEVHNMAEGQLSDKQLIEALLRERDELYRRATKAEHRLAEMSDAEVMRQQYEARVKEKDNEIAQMKADHQKEMSKKDSDFQKELSKKEDEYKKVLSKKEDERNSRDRSVSRPTRRKD